MMRIGAAWAWVVVSALFAGCTASPHEMQVAEHWRPPPTAPSTQPATAIRFPGSEAPPAAADAPFPVPIIELRGDPAAIGAAHGRQLTDDIRLLDEKYIKVFLRTDAQRLQAMLISAAFRARLRPEHRAEVDALAGASGIDQRELMLAQCFLDLSPMVACSTITLPAAAAPDHIARFGRNLDFASLDVADKHSVLFVIHPDDGRYAFAAVGWPGMAGVLSGMNERGLCLANMEVSRRGRQVAAGMPYVLLYRTVLERCGTVDEAIELLKQTPRQTPNNLMLMDAAGDRAVVEITPASVTVRRADDTRSLICTNHQRGQDLDAPGRCRRFDYLHDESARTFGRIGVGKVEDMLGRAAQGDFTIQSMIFEPSTRVIYLAAGKHASSLPYARLDLKPYFAK